MLTNQIAAVMEVNNIIRENIALRQSLTNPYNICIFKNIHNSGKPTGKAIKALVAMHHYSNDCVCGHCCQSWLGPQFWARITNLGI